MTLAQVPLPLTRLNIQRPESGILRVVAGATVTVYNTMPDGSAAVDSSGTVQPTAIKAILFADRGMQSTKTNPMIADSQGLVEFYSKRDDVHIQVVATDGTTYGIPWYATPGIRPEMTVLDFTTVQAAIDATPLGWTLKFPEWAGPYSPPTTSPWIINKGIHLMGNPRNRKNEANLRYFTTGGVNGHKNSSVFELKLGADNVTIEGFTISSGQGFLSESDGTGDAIRYLPTGPDVIVNLTIKHCNILYAGRNGIRLRPGDATPDIGYVVGLIMHDVSLYGNTHDGISLNAITVMSLHEVNATNNLGAGIYCYNCRGSVLVCTGENNQVMSGHGQYGNSPDYAAQFIFDICHGLSIYGCHIEHFEQSSGVKTGICINAGDGNAIEGCNIGVTNVTSGTRGIHFINGAQGCRVGANMYGAVDILVSVQNDGTVYDLLIEPQSAMFCSSPNAKGQLSIPDTTRSFIYVGDYDGSGVATNKGVGLCFPGVAVGSIGAAAKRKRMLFFDDTANQWAYYDSAGALKHITGIT